jgi:hypothetical protein
VKLLFASLLCFVLAVAETFAIKGGPDYGNVKVTTTGIYAGLFIPVGADNSFGIFSANIPKTGIGTGTVAFFRNGIFYPGTFQGVADPDSAVLTGVVDSTFNITFTSEADPVTHVTKNTVVTFNANGALGGQIRPNTNRFSTATARITGNAGITYKTVGGITGEDTSNANSEGPVAYQVSGFKQSEAQ